MSGSFSVTISALDSASGVIARRAEEFGGIGDSLASVGTTGNEFGQSSASAQLSGLTSRYGSLVSGQSHAAQRFLSATADCLGKAADSYGGTDDAAAHSAGTIV